MNEPDADLIRDYYTSRSMPTPSVEAVLATARRARVRRRLLQAAVVTLATCALAIAAMWMFGQRANPEEVASQLMASHRSHPAADFEAMPATFADLDTAYPTLDFAPSATAKQIQTYSLSGARLCKVDKHPALAFRVEGNEASTLFVSRKHSSLGRFGATSVSVDGGAVSFWDDGNLFYALTRN